MTDPILELDHVTVDRDSGRGPVRVLDQVDLQVRPGEVVAVMGPSGSGKSSIVQVGCGILGPTSGAVRIDGEARDTSERRTWARLRRRRIGVVHQRLDLLPGLSVLDNVALPLLLDRQPVADALAAAHGAIERVGLGSLDGASPEDLSGGEQQRVAIARAVVGRRALVLADEPTAALDTVAAETIVSLLVDLAAEGTAVLLTTHDTRLASWADRVVFLRDGRVVDDGAEDPPTTAVPARPERGDR